MKTPSEPTNCQVENLKANGQLEPVSPARAVRLWIRKLLGPQAIKALKNFANQVIDRSAHPASTSVPQPDLQSPPLQAGDTVRVRSLAEVNASLNHWRQLKGCSFAPEMEKYCGTTQKVLKPVRRFVDERDFRVRKARNLVLLEGINCQGTANLGACDRNCFYFWREEWLEKVESRLEQSQG